MTVTQRNFHDLAIEFVGQVEGIVKQAPDEVLDAIYKIKGDGPLATQRVRDIILTEQRKRAKEVIWAARLHQADENVIWIENTSTGQVKELTRMRAGASQGDQLRFAVETVAQYPVKYVGATAGRTLFQAE